MASQATISERIRWCISTNHTLKCALFSLILCLALGSQFGLVSASIPYGEGSYGDCNYTGECTISITTSGTLDIALTPAASGSYSIQKDTVTVDTNSPLGYNLALESGSDTSSALTNGGNTLPAISGSPSSPQILSVNTWGYRLDGQASFGAGPTVATTDAPSSTLTFAGLPLGGLPQTIFTDATATEIGGDPIDIWYGINADTSMPAGAYQQTIIYTAVANP